MRTLFLIAASIALVWLIEGVDVIVGHRLDQFGILPRNVTGLRGIPLSPFLHDGFNHVLSNTLPFAILGSFVAFQGRRVWLEVSLFVIGVGGLAVWVVGRSNLHIGASGLIFGYFGYLVGRGWYVRSLRSIAIAILAVILYGGILFATLPTSTFISWEGHLFGLIAGVLIARIHLSTKSPASESRAS